MALPLLFSFLGGGLAKAGVLGAAGSFLANPLVASAIGSGIGTLAETGDPKKALLGGLGSFAGGHLLGNLMGGVAPGATSTNAISGPMTESLRPMPRPEGLGQAAVSAAAPGARGIFDAGMNFAGSAQGIGSALGGMAPALLQRPPEMPTEPEPDLSTMRPMQRDVRTPGPDFQPGVSGEFDYGVSAPYTSDYMARYAPQRRAMGGFVDNPYAQNYAQERGQMLGGMGLGQPMMNMQQPMGMADGGRLGIEQDYGFEVQRSGPINTKATSARSSKGLPLAALVSAMSGNLSPAFFNRGVTMGTSRTLRGGSQGKAEGGFIESRQRMVPGFGPVMMQAGGIAEMGAEPMPTEQPNEREVISGAISAIMGQHPQPEVVLGMFLQQYGEEALRDLVDRVQSGEFQDTQERFANGENGEVVGPGDGSGVDDMVPAVVDGQGDVLLSDGEFVLRKDATDALNSEFGPEFMDRMNSAGARAPEVVKQMVAA